jgi:hypothetical protein
MFELKPDFEEVRKRFEAWWNCAVVDRPLVSIAFPRPEDERHTPPRKHHASLRDRWMDTEYVVACEEVRLWNTVAFADSLPIAWPNLGPEVFSAFYGCELVFGENTSWSQPILPDGYEASGPFPRLDTSNVYYRKILEMTDALIEAGRGRFIVGTTDLHGGGDALAALRDPQALLLDTLERPDAIRTLCDRITTDFLSVYDLYHRKLSAAGMPSTTWMPALCQGRLHVPSNDFSCMISEAAFEDLFLPGIVRECRHMDRCIYHLDGPGALRYLDRLLDLPEIHAIQWVPGAGQDHWAEWIDVYRRIQARRKALQILSVPAGELDALFGALSPEGVWIGEVSGVTHRQEAGEVLARISGWTRRR